MPINVNTLKTNVEALINKQQAGVLTGTDFNTFMNSAQNLIFEFYRKKFEDNQVIVEALSPFIIETTVSVGSGSYMAGGRVDLPAGYIHRLELAYNKVINSDCGEAPTQQSIPIDYMLANEVSYTLANPIRTPNIAKGILRHTIKNGAIFVYPHTLRSVWLKYLKKPTDAVWAFNNVVTATGDFQQYNAVNSIDLEWNEQQISDFEDVMLMYLGMNTRETELINFAKIKEKEALVN